METGKEGRRQGARKEGRQERREEEKGKERKQKKKQAACIKYCRAFGELYLVGWIRTVYSVCIYFLFTLYHSI